MTISKESEIDALKLYFGEPFVIQNDIHNDIIINQPTIGDIIKNGEKQIYSAVNTLIANPTMYRMQLWDLGVDWNKVSDFSLFCMLAPSIDSESTKLLFGDLNFQLFQLQQTQTEDEGVSYYLFNEEQNVEIDETAYLQMASYLRAMFNTYPKVEKARGKSTKEWMIEEDRMSFEQHKNDVYKSTLLPLISTCLNHPGFKYKKNELREVGIVEFMDSVQRLQVYESSTALLKGIYSGFVDASKIDKNELNFMREISLKN
ncbi:MAG: hypothetical protein [Bacteriophage sp.]|jgi:hypothetical protein|nr:MAG: hypothetical protein [Bacteriophage sp.]DAJ86185.1 MAG TPA: hypothetical protein [Caudoviricetes sp.]DAV71484.1 MAG TPA: hypothetical protein [Caudoviricetes sp.]